MTKLEALEEILGEFGLKIQEYEGCNHIKYIGIKDGNAIIGRESHDYDTENDTIRNLKGCLQSYIEVMINRKMRSGK